MNFATDVNLDIKPPPPSPLLDNRTIHPPPIIKYIKPTSSSPSTLQAMVNKFHYMTQPGNTPHNPTQTTTQGISYNSRMYIRLINLMQLCALTDITLTQFFRQEIPIQNVIVRAVAILLCSVVMMETDTTPKLLPLSTHLRFHMAIVTLFTTFTAPGPFQTLHKQDNSVTIFTVVAPTIIVFLRYLGTSSANPWGRVFLLVISLSTLIATLLLNSMTEQFFTESRILAVLTSMGVYAIMWKGDGK